MRLPLPAEREVRSSQASEPGRGPFAGWRELSPATAGQHPQSIHAAPLRGPAGLREVSRHSCIPFRFVMLSP